MKPTAVKLGVIDLGLLVCSIVVGIYLGQSTQRPLTTSNDVQPTAAMADLYLKCSRQKTYVPNDGDTLTVRVESTPDGYVSTLVINGQDTDARCVATYAARDVF